MTSSSKTACFLAISSCFLLVGGQIHFPGENGGAPSRPNKKPGVGTRTGPLACAEGSVAIAGACHPIFTRGAPACPDKQWLVKNAAGTGECQPKPCPNVKHFLWTLPNKPAKFCADKTAGDESCRELPNQTIKLNKEDGTAGCDCSKSAVFWPPEEKCYPLFSRGPCTEGEVLVYDPQAKFLACQVNPCDEGEGYALWTDGVCYQIEGTASPCGQTPDGEDTLFAINPTTKELYCESNAPKQIIKPGDKAVQCPVGTKQDFAGKCTQTSSFSGGPSSCEKGFIRKPDGSCAKWYR